MSGLFFTFDVQTSFSNSLNITVLFFKMSKWYILYMLIVITRISVIPETLSMHCNMMQENVATGHKVGSFNSIPE